MEQPGRGPLRWRPPARRRGRPGGGHRVIGRPAHDLAAARIEHPGHVEPTFFGGHVGDVSLPHLAGSAGAGSRVGQVVGSDGAEVAAVGGAGPEAPLLPGAQPGSTHQPGHPVATTRLARPAQRHREPGAAVGAPARLEELARLAAQTHVLFGARTIRPSFAPRSRRYVPRRAPGRAFAPDVLPPSSLITPNFIAGVRRRWRLLFLGSCAARAGRRSRAPAPGCAVRVPAR